MRNEGLKFGSIEGLDTHAAYLDTASSTGSIDRTESKILMALAVPDTFRPVQILEIGTFQGGTTTNLAKIARAFGGHVYTVDVLEGGPTLPDVQKGEVLAGTGRLGADIPDDLRPFVTQLLLEPTVLALEKALAEHDKVFDLVFIDGDHSYEVVRAQFDLCCQYCDPDRIILHDVWWDVEPPPVDGPLRLACEEQMTVLNLTHLARVGGQVRARGLKEF